jgi:hypothetical protein
MSGPHSGDEAAAYIKAVETLPHRPDADVLDALIQPPKPPTTTAQQDMTMAGQRKVNLIWEYTQATVAICVVMANIVVWVSASLRGTATPIPEGLTNALFLIVGFYFSRTNHAAIGGVGYKPVQEYVGR